MINVTRINGSKYYVNALMIESVEEVPDTLITLTNGKKLMVIENSSDVVREIRSYLRSIGVLAAVTSHNNTESEGATS